MFDQKLVEHCSAVLAGLKTANLFSYTVGPGDDVRQLVTDRNRNYSFHSQRNESKRAYLCLPSRQTTGRFSAGVCKRLFKELWLQRIYCRKGNRYIKEKACKF